MGRAAMPCKFDDISKVAAEVLNDDYQTKGQVFKTKQKTSYGGAVLSTQVDFFGDKGVASLTTSRRPLPPTASRSASSEAAECEQSQVAEFTRKRWSLDPFLSLPWLMRRACVTRRHVTKPFTSCRGATPRLKGFGPRAPT